MNPANPLFQPWRSRYFAGEPLRIGRGTFSLVDDYLVEDHYGLERKTGPMTRLGPLVGDAGGKDGPLPGLHRVIYDPVEDLWKGWYQRYRIEPGIETGYNYSTYYAESRDGLRWSTPDTGGGGEAPNRILHRDDGTFLLEEVWLDQEAQDPAQRFVALVKTTPPGERERCLVQMTSPDGKRWCFGPQPIVLFRGACDGSYSMVEAEGGGWFLYRRPATVAMRREGAYANGHPRRRLACCYSEDRLHWSAPHGMALADEVGLPDLDTFHAVRYHDLFLGFAGWMDNPALLPKVCELVYSREGLLWQRLPTRPCPVPNGSPGAWDAESITFSALVEEGKHLRLYYIGADQPQNSHGASRTTATGVALFEKDRLIGWGTGSNGGYLLTRRFVLESDQIFVEVGPDGGTPLVRAELLDAQGDGFHSASTLPGFSMEESLWEGGALHWRSTPSLAGLRGRTVQLRFYLQEAILYTLRFS